MSSFCARAPSATSAGTRRRATDNVASQTPSLLELAETLAFAAMQSPARARWRRLGCARSPSKAKDSCTVRGVSCAICGRIPTSDGCSRHKTSWKNPAGCRPAGFDDGPCGRLLETETCIGMDGFFQDVLCREKPSDVGIL